MMENMENFQMSYMRVKRSKTNSVSINGTILGELELTQVLFLEPN